MTEQGGRASGGGRAAAAGLSVALAVFSFALPAPSLAAGGMPGSGPGCSTTTNPSYSVVSCVRTGLDRDGRLLGCRWVKTTQQFAGRNLMARERLHRPLRKGTTYVCGNSRKVWNNLNPFWNCGRHLSNQLIVNRSVLARLPISKTGLADPSDTNETSNTVVGAGEDSVCLRYTHRCSVDVRRALEGVLCPQAVVHSSGPKEPNPTKSTHTPIGCTNFQTPVVTGNNTRRTTFLTCYSTSSTDSPLPYRTATIALAVVSPQHSK